MKKLFFALAAVLALAGCGKEAEEIVQVCESTQDLTGTTRTIRITSKDGAVTKIEETVRLDATSLGVHVTEAVEELQKRPDYLGTRKDGLTYEFSYVGSTAIETITVDPSAIDKSNLLSLQIVDESCFEGTDIYFTVNAEKMVEYLESSDFKASCSLEE